MGDLASGHRKSTHDMTSDARQHCTRNSRRVETADPMWETEFLGLKLRNPLVAASGPPTKDFAAIRRLSSAGIGAAITKTILVEPSVNPQPCLHRGPGFFFNTERCSTLPLSQWLREELPRLAELPMPVIASIGMTADEVSELAVPVVEAGADALELSIFTPPDDPGPMIRALHTVKEKVSVPVTVKLSCNVPDIVAFGLALREHGADGFSSIDALKAGLDVDPLSGAPVLMEQGYGRISGEAIRVLALYHVAMLNHYVGLPVIGTGGVMSGEDAVKMLFCGAQCVGVCTSLILGGADSVRVLLAELADAIKSSGHRSVNTLRGRTLESIQFPVDEVARQEYEHIIWDGVPRVALINQKNCIQCGKCFSVCPYGAIRNAEARFSVLPQQCQGCGLCVSICPVRAIDWELADEQER